MDQGPKIQQKTDEYNTATPQDRIDRHRPNVNSVRFEDPYENINPKGNIHDGTHIIYTQEQNR